LYPACAFNASTKPTWGKCPIVIVIVIVGLNVSGRTLFRHHEVYLVPYTLMPPTYASVVLHISVGNRGE